MSAQDLLSFEAALAQLLAAATATPRGVEWIATHAARGRVLAEDLAAPVDVPPLDNSAMDGYALRVADLAAGLPLPVAARIAAGAVGAPLPPGTAARIFTGAPVPAGADAVVMQEHTELIDGALRCLREVKPGQHIRRRGEDIQRGDVVLPAGTRLNAAHLGVAASVGAARLPVWPSLRVAVFSTGDELAEPGLAPEQLRPGMIYNSNRTTLLALLGNLGCATSDLGIIPDSLAATREALTRAAREHDVVLTSGGVSVGEEDHVKPAVESLGALALWKIAIKPGKPLAFGHLRRDDGSRAHFVGMPGNPVSSFVTFLALVRPLLLALQGAPQTEAGAVPLRADFAWPASGGKLEARREFLRVRRNAEGGLELFPHQGSGVLSSCAWGDGLVDNPPNTAIGPGDTVRFLSYASLGV